MENKDERRVANKLAKIRNLLLEIDAYTEADGEEVDVNITLADVCVTAAMKNLGYTSTFGKNNSIRAVKYQSTVGLKGIAT